MLGGLIGVVSAWTVFHLEVDAVVALALITFAVPVFIWKPWLAKALPPVFHRLAFPVMVTLFALDLWTNREPLPAMIRLDLMLLGYRCVSPRGRREDLQLILLALFLVVVTGVFTVSPAFVLQILMFTAAALGLLFAVTLSDSRQGGATPAATTGWERVSWPELLRRLRAATDLRVVGLGALLFAGVVVLSVVLFLALPRFELSNSLFLERLITRKSQSGFSEEVRFGEVVDIAQDNSMAFAVDALDPSAVPAEPYWRMLVLDEYSGEGFRMSSGLRSGLSHSAEKSTVHIGGGSLRDSEATWVIYYQPGVSRYLPLLGAFGRVTFNDTQTLVQAKDLRLAALAVEPTKMVGMRIEAMEADGRLPDPVFAERLARLRAEPQADLEELREDRRRRRAARVEQIAAGLAEAAEGTEPRPRRRGRGDDFYDMAPPPDFLGLDVLTREDRERLASWAGEIGGAGRGGEEFARRAAEWLRARHEYSLRSQTPSTGGDDVLVRWIGSSEPGHCEMFAGSLVLLARAAGVPARVVTGFKGGVWNGTSGNITVKNSDAHAWVEIWEEAEGGYWMRTDPTPGARLAPPAPGAEPKGVATLVADRGWNARLDSLRVFWYRRIVNFDQSSQFEMLRGTKQAMQAVLAEAREALEKSAASAIEWLRRPWGAGRVAQLGFAAVAAAALAWWWRRTGRAWLLAWRSRRTATHRHDPVRIEASRWLRRLGELRPADGESAAEIEATRAELLRLRFGARERWPAPAAVFVRARRAGKARRR